MLHLHYPHKQVNVRLIYLMKHKYVRDVKNFVMMWLMKVVTYLRIMTISSIHKLVWFVKMDTILMRIIVSNVLQQIVLIVLMMNVKCVNQDMLYIQMEDVNHVLMDVYNVHMMIMMKWNVISANIQNWKIIIYLVNFWQNAFHVDSIVLDVNMLHMINQSIQPT